MALKPEYKAMMAIDRAFDALKEDDKNRVCKWAVEKYGDSAEFTKPSTTVAT